MVLLSAGEATQLQAIDESLMTETAILRRYVSVPDNAGGTTDSYSNYATVKCRINVVGVIRITSDKATAGELQNVALFVLHFPVGTQVGNKDQVLIGTRTFEVDKPLDHTYQTSLRVTATEIT